MSGKVKKVEFIIDDISVNKTNNNRPSSTVRTDCFQSSNRGSIPVGPPNYYVPNCNNRKNRWRWFSLLDKNPNFEYELIENLKKDNLIKELPVDAVTLRVAKLDKDILQHCKDLR